MIDGPSAFRRRGPLASAALLALTSQPAYGQNQPARTNVLEEIVVTATRVATNLQQTPMSIAALTGEDLELSGIDSGRELGIMVPNVVINPTALGEFNAKMIVRGLPGVTTYVDGIWFGDFGLLQRRFVEIERVEVLRGPQGTLFGRNSNGGAIQIVTRPPAAEFGARLDVQVGEFEEPSLSASVDLPFADRLRSKWTVARAQNDGFLESQTAPFALGDYENSLLRADFVWEPTDRLSLRFNINEEDRESTTARVIRNMNLQSYIAYNVLAGNPDFLAQARAINPAFPNPPFCARRRSVHAGIARGRVPGRHTRQVGNENEHEWANGHRSAMDRRDAHLGPHRPVVLRVVDELQRSGRRIDGRLRKLRLRDCARSGPPAQREAGSRAAPDR